MKIIDTSVFLQIFEFDENAASDSIDIAQYDEYLEKVKKWADEHYPDVEVINRCSFAALILYYVTGYYGGYGTEANSKEQLTEQKVCAFYNQYNKELSPTDLSESVISLCINNLLRA